MAKAILTRMDATQSPLDYDYSMVLSDTRRTYRMSYEYHLTYVSYEPINMSDFPREIDTENVTRNFVTSPTPANPNCKILKATVTKIEKPNRIVNNSIGQLEVED
jgi:hypothetical protein